ncbi:gamma-glutamyltransferase [Leptothoe spongobia]|uniref:Glutathione hydrolase proenzyme n=1 Tax=Leptothoe spongobia TAU-MAC 1115 TaxID=1967444 RepID=A0A947GKR5_9CYAN|nr:gamma-glutamyltransferase [Leptothoe spongobia]MBT9317128.1 gamma-glutamyltransferase [Leptothoe spongobia TAU-MAC 1115]
MKLRTQYLLSILCAIGVMVMAAFVGIAQTVDKVPVSKGVGGAVASVDVDASRIGIEVLRQGGNAVDAAVATAAALGVTEPFSAGIGGGGFIMIYLHDQDRVITLDGREEAPAAVTADLFRDPDDPAGGNLPFFPNRISSGLAVGVPGTPLNWQTALDRYGTLSLAEALAPATELAETGFTVDGTFAQQVVRNQERFGAFTSTSQLYLPNGAPPEVGSTFKNPDMANTYRLLATQGVNSFYRGDISEAIVETVKAPPVVDEPTFKVQPGGMTLGDLDRYEVRVRPPVVSDYRGYRFYGMGLPSSGGITVAQTLGILEGSDLGSLKRSEALHQVIEAERLAFCDRNTYLGDPEYIDAPVTGLLSPAYTANFSLPKQAVEPCITPGNPLPYQTDPSPSLTQVPQVAAGNSQEGLSTTHLVTADQYSNVVSYTLTIESTGGSGMVVPGYGFILNNELTDFDTVLPHPNAPEPGKRPRSSMAPTIALTPNGRILALGSPGGSTIITTVVGIVTNMLDFDMPLPQAISAPRLSQRNVNTTLLERTLEEMDETKALSALGHEFRLVDEIGAATGLEIWPNGEMQAAAEPNRRGGGAAMVVNPAENH